MWSVCRRSSCSLRKRSKSPFLLDHAHRGLGGEHDLVAVAALERLAHDDLAVAAVIGIARVQVIDAVVDGIVQHADRLRLVDVGAIVASSVGKRMQPNPRAELFQSSFPNVRYFMSLLLYLYRVFLDPIPIYLDALLAQLDADERLNK